MSGQSKCLLLELEAKMARFDEPEEMALRSHDHMAVRCITEGLSSP